MNIALWIIQIILGIKVIIVSYTHGLRQSKPTTQEATQEAMQEAMQKMGLFPKAGRALVGLLKWAGLAGEPCR